MVFIIMVKIYLVGGAVRDKILGREIKERDFVVVGATPEFMRAQGYKQVGRDFPVFLHPVTGEEYALARKERKQGSGYHGFQCFFSPDVTLEEDLVRRDLTINAMASDESGTIIDPCNGLNDIKNKKLKHISKAFCEDPLRVLRVARFGARYYSDGFRVDRETQILLMDMVRGGELNDLTTSRVWQELNKSLEEDRPDLFIKILRHCGALHVLFPEIDALFGVPNHIAAHPEIDTGIHTLLSLRQAVRLTKDLDVRFAVLCHDLGKGDTNPCTWPKHTNHETYSVERITEFCKKYPVPVIYQELAQIFAKIHTLFHDVDTLTVNAKLRILDNMDVFRRPGRMVKIINAATAESRGRLTHEQDPYPQAKIWNDIFRKAASINVQELQKQGLVGAALGEAIRIKRLEAISKLSSKCINTM